MLAHNKRSSTWIASALLAIAVAGAAWTSFSSNGLRLETAGVEMTMKASVDQGLMIKFVSVR